MKKVDCVNYKKGVSCNALFCWDFDDRNNEETCLLALLPEPVEMLLGGKI